MLLNQTAFELFIAYLPLLCVYIYFSIKAVLMPWTYTDYPVSMKNLPGEVRHKAIEIANALLREGKIADEGIVIATAISHAKTWAANRGINTDLNYE